jgi:hypothetical protein
MAFDLKHNEVMTEGHIVSLVTLDDGDTAIQIEERGDRRPIVVLNCDECDTLIAALIQVSDWANWRWKPDGI